MNRSGIASGFAAWVSASVLVASTSLAAAPGVRSYVSAVRVGGAETARIDVSPPRMEAAELNKSLADPDIRNVLNQDHLARLGTLSLARGAVFGERYVGGTPHELGIEVGKNGALFLLVHRTVAPLRIALDMSNSGGHVPQPTFAFLSGPTAESFELEVRFGSLRGTTPLDFTDSEVIAGMNNLAHALLTETEASRESLMEALKLAKVANDRTSSSQPQILDTLALALFRNGEFDQAIKMQERAVSLATEGSKERTQLQAQLQQMIAARAGK